MFEYCYVCYAEHLKSDFCDLSCGCRFCREVIRAWIITQLNKYFVEDFFIICPKGDRGHYLDEEDIRKSLSTEEFSNYQFILLKRSLSHDEDYRYCPSRKCNYIGWIDTSSTCTSLLECPMCLIKWKDPTLNPLSRRLFNYLKAVFTGNIEIFSLLWKELWTKLCPMCSFPIEKNGGCPHMICQNCNHEFCWNCLSDYNNHNFSICEFRFAYSSIYFAWVLILLILKIFYSSPFICEFALYSVKHIIILTISSAILLLLIATAVGVYYLSLAKWNRSWSSLLMLASVLLADYFLISSIESKTYDEFLEIVWLTIDLGFTILCCWGGCFLLYFRRPPITILIKSALILLLLAILIEFLVLRSPEDPRRQDISPQEKIKSVKGNILDDEGKLIHSGYLTKPGMQWDFDALKSKWNKRYRFKEWEFYAIHHQNVTISFGIANFHYVASLFFTVYEKGSTPQYHQKLILPNEELTLAKHPLNGKTIYESGNYIVNFKNRDNKFKHLELKFEDKLQLSLDVFKKTEDSMASLTPFNSDGSNFYYTYKDYNNYVSGQITAFGKVYDFNDRIGMIDWGRGVWPYHSFWIWGSGQGKIGPNSAIGLNIGEFMFSPTSKATEDCVFLDRTMYKLGNFITSYPKDLSQPWEFKTTNIVPTEEYGAASIIFYPEVKSIFASNFWLIQSHFDQAFGVFEGNITTRDGEISFKARGLVEVHHTRW